MTLSKSFRKRATQVAAGAGALGLSASAFASDSAISVVDFSAMLPSFEGVTSSIVAIGVALLTIGVSIKGYRIVASLINR